MRQSHQASDELSGNASAAFSDSRELIRIIVAAHIDCEVPSDPIYLPLFVGAAGTPDSKRPSADRFTMDDTGDNISALNYSFCELTGLYWAWKNVRADYIGLVHYRRYFTGIFEGFHVDAQDIAATAVTYEEMQPLLGSYAVFVPRKRHYYIETLDSHYEHTHDEEHIRLCRQIISESCPEYVKVYDRVMRRRWGYMFNLMILRSDLLDEYCTWLFDILFELHNRVDDTHMDEFDRRYCGRVGEILFNVWLEQAVRTGRLRRKEILELPYAEDVIWGRKIKNFLAAKFLGRHYSRSVSGKTTPGRKRTL